MKLINLEVLAIKNVVRQDDDGFNEGNYESFKTNPQYSDYINNVDIDINQAFSRLVTSEKILIDTFDVNYDKNATIDENKPNIPNVFFIDIPQNVLSKLYKIKSIVFVCESGIYPCSFTKVKKSLIMVDKFSTNGKYVINYCIAVPSMEYETHYNVELSDYGITDTIIYSFVLPFVKSKLWEFEEPVLSQKHLNIAESYLGAYDGGDEVFYQDSVNTHYYY